MIGSLRGVISLLATDYCLLENNGVGYRVFMPAISLSQIKTGQEIRVFTYMAVREDAILLYGFLTQEYYQLFLQLTAVSGVGPKVALGVLSASKPENFYLAIQNRNIKVLTSLPGIGKKMAERLILELKDKVESMDTSGANEDVASSYEGADKNISEAIEALRSLGYTNTEIYPIVKAIPNCSELSTENIIRQALRNLAGRK
ncbi:MAG: Holliday junction branch migration protein RuvA [Acholeplasmataceae bacterium]|jgi:Holliday junction DNA helicase RuvA|nr:Holliday junction branch migration protein RuvA [Acholeplasmataceae bacterium]